jgi:hypothetical protein
MIWLSWRQFRPQAVTAAGALIVMAIMLAATGPGVSSDYATSGLSACHANCATLVSSFLLGLNPLDRFIWLCSVVLMYLAPALMGLFWGAPLVARELETGTHRIAWNQSVTRTRWTLVKLGLVGLAAVATAGLLSLMVTWWAGPIDRATSLMQGGGHVKVGGESAGFGLARIDPVIFAARGVAPLGYAAFAFALGVTAGVLWRRTLPAMAATLVVFAVIQVVVPNFVRPHLIPPAHVTAPVKLQTASINLVGNPATGRVTGIGITEPYVKQGAWVLSNTIITRSGAELTVPPGACTGMNTPASARAGYAGCLKALAAMHLRQFVSYQPGSRFWPLQWIETGIYLVLAAALGCVCVWQVRRRRTP